MARLAVKDLSKSFDDITAVDDISFEIEDGEFVVMVGPSGCGKSTTLNCITGLDKPTEGNIIIDGDDVTDLKPQNRDNAMVFQDYALYPHKNVRDNIGFGLKMRTNLSKQEINEKVEETAELLEITELLDKKPQNLSGGQQQRVALGRAIIREPDVFLMDEPLSNLDAKLRIEMRARLQELHEQLNVTTLYVTHDQDEAMTMGDRIIVMKEGKIQQFATPLECYYEPTNIFVANFIGSPSLNTFSVYYNGGMLHHEEFSINLPDSVNPEQVEDKDLVLGIRPESIEIENKSERSGIGAQVRIVEPKGDVTNLHLNVGSKELIAVMDGYTRFSPDDHVNMKFPTDEIYIFDNRTGNSIKTPDILNMKGTKVPPGQ